MCMLEYQTFGAAQAELLRIMFDITIESPHLFHKIKSLRRVA